MQAAAKELPRRFPGVHAMEVSRCMLSENTYKTISQLLMSKRHNPDGIIAVQAR